mmetsp:Transcript_55682/g.107437  ORF Transcript_55682/g.107437 Transcript_55682/m.107437 type:complete len:111 (+) Transcript_55682:412-744(+)
MRCQLTRESCLRQAKQHLLWSNSCHTWRRPFRQKKRNHEKRLKAFKLNKDALQRETKSFNKLSEKRSIQFAKIRSAVDAVKKKDATFLYAFAHAVHDATVDDDVHATVQE